MPSSRKRLRGSFRDPSGFLFRRNGEIYRQVNLGYRQDYELFRKSGLYDKLVEDEHLITHHEVKIKAADLKLAYKIIKPLQLPFISYPYEWSFSQVKDAALLTLELQKLAIAHGLSLKDAATTNIQFHRGRPILIDSLSFEAYPEGRPWVAYRQFCQHFLGPLALMAKRDVRLSQLLRVHLDGIPLDLASRLLPWQTRFNMGMLTHIHLHAAAQKSFAGQTVPDQSRRANVSKMAMLGLIDHLERTIQGLHWKPEGTAWGDYTRETSYSAKAAVHKKQLVDQFIQKTKAKVLWDLGANAGLYSRLASKRGIFTLAADYDPGAVEINYLEIKRKREREILPLIVDLGNPSASIGWANEEHQSLVSRGPADAVMALALVHHLAIANNVPLARIADFFSKLGNWLIIEFVPKRDPQVQKLLAARKDIFTEFHEEGFKAAFEREYHIVAESPIRDSARSLYLMRQRG